MPLLSQGMPFPAYSSLPSNEKRYNKYIGVVGLSNNLDNRFVTGFCDSRQTSNHKQTMYEVAATIGMPVTFVDLRHECAHADPPSRYRLERSVGQALDWMWEIYWSRLGDEGEHELISSEDEYGLQDNGDEAVYSVAENVNADDVPEKQQLQGSLRVVLKNYLATRKNVVCQRREDGYDVNIARSEESSIRSTYKELMQICERKANRLHILQTVLLEIKIMLPSTEAYVFHKTKDSRSLK